MFWVEKQGRCCDTQKVVEEKNSCNLFQPQCLNIKTVMQLFDIAISDVKELKKTYGVEKVKKTFWH